jgi:hypothetical protein
MISRQAKKLVLARERLQTLTPAELTEVSGGGGGGGRERRHHKRRHYRHREHKHGD